MHLRRSQLSASLCYAAQAALDPACQTKLCLDAFVTQGRPGLPLPPPDQGLRFSKTDGSRNRCVVQSDSNRRTSIKCLSHCSAVEAISNDCKIEMYTIAAIRVAWHDAAVARPSSCTTEGLEAGGGRDCDGTCGRANADMRNCALARTLRAACGRVVQRSAKPPRHAAKLQASPGPGAVSPAACFKAVRSALQLGRATAKECTTRRSCTTVTCARRSSRPRRC